MCWPRLVLPMYVNPDGVSAEPYALPDVNDATFRAELAALPASTDAGTGDMLSQWVAYSRIKDAVVASARLPTLDWRLCDLRRLEYRRRQFRCAGCLGLLTCQKT